MSHLLVEQMPTSDQDEQVELVPDFALGSIPAGNSEKS